MRRPHAAAVLPARSRPTTTTSSGRPPAARAVGKWRGRAVQALAHALTGFSSSNAASGNAVFPAGLLPTAQTSIRLTQWRPE